MTFDYLRCLKEHVPPIHSDLVCAGVRRSKEDNVFIGESLQRFGLSSLIHRHVLSTHAQPEIMRETTFFTLHTESQQASD